MPPEAIKAVPVRHWSRWVSALLVLLFVAWLVTAAINSHFIDFGEVRRFLFNPLIRQGVKNTIILSLVAQAAGIVLGVVFALMRVSKNPVMKAVASFYIWFLRGT